MADIYDIPILPVTLSFEVAGETWLLTKASDGLREITRQADASTTVFMRVDSVWTPAQPIAFTQAQCDAIAQYMKQHPISQATLKLYADRPVALTN